MTTPEEHEAEVYRRDMEAARKLPEQTRRVESKRRQKPPGGASCCHYGRSPYWDRWCTWCARAIESGRLEPCAL